MTAAPPPLSCTVRDCGLPLTRHAGTYRCPNGHAYDVARRGYVNLLQPQDRRSLTAGDSRTVVSARARLEAVPGMSVVMDAFVEYAAALALRDEAIVMDLGAGTGATLGRLANRHPTRGVGIDLSVAAAEHAARRFPDQTWVVANADRRLPLLDGSVDLAVSLHARRNPDECARVLTADGLLLVAVPAPDDLMELRAAVQGQGLERDRTRQLADEHAPFFEEVARKTVRGHASLSGGALTDLLAITYRGGRGSRTRRLDALERLDVTLASDLCLFRRRGV